MQDRNPSTASRWSRRLGLAGLLAAIALGAVLRLLWVNDIEFKADEAWTFEQSQQAARSGAWPGLGMPSSAGFRNPGMSLWVFVLLGKITGVDEPTRLARAVQVLSVLAIVALVLFAYGCVGREEREPWLWAAALVAL